MRPSRKGRPLVPECERERRLRHIVAELLRPEANLKALPALLHLSPSKVSELVQASGFTRMWVTAAERQHLLQRRLAALEESAA